MVLFAEVCDDETAVRIADYCWQEIESNSEPNVIFNQNKYLRRLHSLRFLAEAFRGRHKALERFQSQLGEQVLQFARHQNDLVAKKHAVEAVAILKPEDTGPVLISAMETKNAWINETALRASRYLAKIDPGVVSLMEKYLWSLMSAELVRRREELYFSLGISDVFKPVARYFKILYINVVVTLCATVAFIILSPTIFFVFLVYLYILGIFLYLFLLGLNRTKPIHLLRESA